MKNSLAFAGLAIAFAAAATAAPPQFTFAIPASRSAIPEIPPTIPPDTPKVAPYEFVYQAPHSFEFLDFDGDGYLDMLVAPAFSQHMPYLPIEIWLNDRGGHFAQGTAAVLDGPAPQTWNPTDILFGDFNEDGRQDVLIVNSGGEFAVADSDPVQGFHQVLLLSQPDGKYVDATANITPNADTFNHMGAVGDVNGDGHLDAVVNAFHTNDQPNEGVRLLVGDGTGHLAETTQGLPLDIRWMRFQDRTAADYQITGCAGLADLDGDTTADLITGSYSADDLLIPQNQRVTRTIRFYHRDSISGEFVEMSRVAIPAALADIGYSADTRANDPSGAGLGCSQIISGDLDGDGRDDVVVEWEGAGKWYIELLHNDGGFQFSDMTLTAAGGYAMGFQDGSSASGPAHFRLRDIDGDGTLDIVSQLSPTSIGNLPPHAALVNDGRAHFVPWVLHGPAGSPLAPADYLSASICSGCLYEPFVFDAGHSGRASLVLLDFQSSVTDSSPVMTTTVYLTAFAPAAELAIFRGEFD